MEKCVEMFKTAVFLSVQSQKGIMGTHVRSPGSFYTWNTQRSLAAAAAFIPKWHAMTKTVL